MSLKQRLIVLSLGLPFMLTLGACAPGAGGTTGAERPDYVQRQFPFRAERLEQPYRPPARRDPMK